MNGLYERIFHRIWKTTRPVEMPGSGACWTSGLQAEDTFRPCFTGHPPRHPSSPHSSTSTCLHISLYAGTQVRLYLNFTNMARAYLLRVSDTHFSFTRRINCWKHPLKVQPRFFFFYAYSLIYFLFWEESCNVVHKHPDCSHGCKHLRNRRTVKCNRYVFIPFRNGFF